MVSITTLGGHVLTVTRSQSSGAVRSILILMVVTGSLTVLMEVCQISIGTNGNGQAVATGT